MKRYSLAFAASVLVLGLGFAVYAQEQTPTTGPVPITQVPGTPPVVAPGQPSQPAVTVTTVPSPAAPTHPIEQVEWGLVASFLLRYLMKKGWLAFLTPAATAQVKAICGFLVAATTAAGIHFAVTGSILDGGGAAITITGISWDAIKDIGFQWASQQAWYEGLVKETV